MFVRNCTYCGKEVRYYAKRCAYCGSVLKVPVYPAMRYDPVQNPYPVQSSCSTQAYDSEQGYYPVQNQYPVQSPYFTQAYDPAQSYLPVQNQYPVQSGWSAQNSYPTQNPYPTQAYGPMQGYCPVQDQYPLQSNYPAQNSWAAPAYSPAQNDHPVPNAYFVPIVKGDAAGETARDAAGMPGKKTRYTMAILILLLIPFFGPLYGLVAGAVFSDGEKADSRKNNIFAVSIVVFALELILFYYFGPHVYAWR